MKAYGLMLAGGIGSRCGSDIPKQYIDVDGKPIFLYALEALESSGKLEGVCVVCATEWSDFVQSKCIEHSVEPLCFGVGGSTGIESLWNGVMALENCGLKDDDIIVIQDANRPFLAPEDVEMGIQSCMSTGCSFGAIPQVCEQAYIASSGQKELVLRDGLYELIRPEFHTLKNLKYCKKLYSEKTFKSQNPACMLLENGEDIGIFETKSSPVKVTYPSDLEAVTAILHLRNSKNLMEKDENFMNINKTTIVCGGGV